MGVLKRKYSQPPRTGMEVFMMLPEGTPAELINDTIYMSPSPNYNHQDLSGELFVQIRSYVKSKSLGNCLADIDIFLDNKNVLRPDILFIASENMSIIKDNRIKGTPDLVIEILSAGNRKHDTERKKVIYEKFGVKEYFIIDPETKDTIAWHLSEKKYTKRKSVKGRITSKQLKKTFSF